MRRSLPFLLLLVLLAACSAPPTNRTGPATSTNANAPAETTSTSAPAMTEADAIAQEKAIWDAIRKKDWDAFTNMLASDQMEVTNTGVNDKATSVKGVKTFEPSDVNFSDWKFLPIDKDAFLIVYTVAVKGKMEGKEFPPITAHASSAWAHRDGKWLAIYHQESEVAKEQPPPPPPKASPAASTTPAATGTPGTTSSDPVANEKLIYDLLKSKNYDGFEALLDPKSIEVEPTGVYDKAQSVKLIRNFDFSKIETSEFKPMTIDKDAALVTYLVKIPGPKPVTERHTTIWVDRNGKWLALFHHGTIVKKM
jgi:hypothetical protein